MALLLKPLPCPHCKTGIDKRQLRSNGLLKDFLASKPIACPHCQESIVYPENADTLLSSGLFVCVILAPLFQLWEVQSINPVVVFGTGIAVTIAGMFQQKLVKAPQPAQDHKQ